MRKGEIPNEVESRYMNEELEDPTDKICSKFPSTIPDGTIHVLVVVPEQAQPQMGLWLVNGSIENAKNTKGIRCRLYRLVASYLGYYDPARRTGDKDNALWYEDKTLRIHSLFET
ncbi:hypothetical protein PC123_g28110, partial [Phytophthora cactorum]